MNVYRKFLTVDFNDLNQNVSVVYNGESQKVDLLVKDQNDATVGVLPIGLVKDPTSPDADKSISAGSGIVIGTGDVVSVDTTWLEGFVANLGYIKNDSDTLYHADNTTINIDGNNTFSVNSGWLNGVIEGKGYLVAADLADYAQTSAIPVNVSQLTNDAGYITGYVDTTYQAGDGVVIDPTNTITVTVDAASEGFLTVGENGIKLTGVQAAIDTAVSGLASEQFVLDKIAEIEDENTTYQAGEGLSLDTETNTFALTAVIPTTVAELTDEANYAKKTDLPTRVGELNNDKGFATIADLEAVKLSLLSQIGNVTSVVSIDNTAVGNINENLFVEVSTPISSNTTFAGKNITVQELTNENSYSRFTSEGDITLSNVSSEGTLVKNATNGNAQLIINTPERVVITDSTLNQNGYNAIEIGTTTATLPKSVLIDGITFGGNLSNNTISIFGTQDDAVITISNCNFVKCSNPVRISNRTGAHVTINLVNCTFGDWESAQPAWGGIFCCQDYTSPAADAMNNNLFGSDKVIINITNCNHKGTPITFTDMAEVADTGDANQLIYVYYDSVGSIKYSEAPDHFPTMNVINN